MAKEYIERREGSFYLVGSRVPLARIVFEFQNGAAPEAIRLDYPTLSLEQVYGAIAFYLANKEEIERDTADRRRIEEEVIKAQPPLSPEFQHKLERAREQILSRRSWSMIRFMADADLNATIVGGCRRRRTRYRLSIRKRCLPEGRIRSRRAGFGRCGGSRSRLTWFSLD
jgi:uncharacterized protein (DUF433 family)